MEAMGPCDHAHPWTALALAGVPLLLLASQAARVDPNLPRGDWLPPRAESVQAFHSLEKMGRAAHHPIAAGDTRAPLGFDFADRVRGGTRSRASPARLASDPRADRVISLSTLTEGHRDALGTLSSETRRSFLRGDGRATLVELLPASWVSPTEQIRWVRELRRLAWQML